MADLAASPAKIVRILDCETTGFPDEEPVGLVELGWWDLDLATMTIGNPVSYLVNPGHPIPPVARGVHHISDRQVADAMPPDQAVAFMLKDLGAGDVLCAHHADFEKFFVDAGTRPWLDTWKIALRAWPDFKSHGNQAIRYERGFDDREGFDSAAAMPPHRALPDAYTTAHIIRDQLELRPIERLIEISGQPGFLTKIGGQKHKGKTFKEVVAVDPAYLEWIVNKSDMDEAHKLTAKWHLDRRAAA